MANVGDIYQFRLDQDQYSRVIYDDANIKEFDLDPSKSVRIGISTKEINYFRIYDNDLAQVSRGGNLNDDITMIIQYADESTPSSTIQLGKTFMYESQVAIKIKKISFVGNHFPPGTYLEIRYE